MAARGGSLGCSGLGFRARFGIFLGVRGRRFRGLVRVWSLGFMGLGFWVLGWDVLLSCGELAKRLVLPFSDLGSFVEVSSMGS